MAPATPPDPSDPKPAAPRQETAPPSIGQPPVVSRLRLVNKLLIGLALAVMLKAGAFSAPEVWTVAALFALWVALPLVLVLWFSARAPLQGRGAARVLLWVGVILGIAMLIGCWQAFVDDPDPQAGLVFVALPLWQLAIVLATWALLRWRLRSAPNDD